MLKGTTMDEEREALRRMFNHAVKHAVYAAQMETGSTGSFKAKTHRREADAAREAMLDAALAHSVGDALSETFEQKNIRNSRVSHRYDKLMREGKHGHYETMFRVVREEIERARLRP